MKIIVGITGATGAQMGYRFLSALKDFEHVETHLVISHGAEATFALETPYSLDEVRALADYSYDDRDLGAKISSGSFETDGMVVIPCSMKTLSAVACGYADNLVSRAADVCLKENRRVVLVPREMPLGKIHCKNLLSAAEAGCTIIPPMLTFYSDYPTVQDQVEHVIGKILMQFGLEYDRFKPWKGVPVAAASEQVAAGAESGA